MALLTPSLPNVDYNRPSMKNLKVNGCKYSGCQFFYFLDAVPANRVPVLIPKNVNRPWKLDILQSFSSGLSPLGQHTTFASRPFTKMASNGYVGGASYKEKIYTRLDSCLVIPPTNRKKPRAIIKFLGGAFIGAAPEVTYSHLIHLLAKEGFLIISVPYNVTFDHAQAAKEVYERFHTCMDMLLMSGLPYANLTKDDLAHLPLYSVGHSNGALLQLLTGSYFSEKIPKFGPMVNQMMPLVEASPFYEMARSATGDAWKAIFNIAGTMIRDLDQEAMVSMNKFVDQLPSVMNQVTQGVSEFKPTPSENRDFFKKAYNVHHTLLVKFSSDAIDESDLLEEILKPRVESLVGTLEKVSLSGNHLTPCVQDLKWQVGDVYTPADALAQGLKSLSLNDTKVLARTISNWFNSLCQ